MSQTIESREVTRLADGPVNLYTLRNSNGFTAQITNYGGIIVSLLVPDRNGQFRDVVLGLNSVQRYVETKAHFGAVIGRYANRIACAQFTLDGHTHHLTRNDGNNHLHGGHKAFDKVVWNGEVLQAANGPALRLTHLSPHGEEGYPGNLHAAVTYALADDDALRIEYEAATNRPTIINLTNHSYFNLAGAGNGDVLNHEIRIYADHFTPTDPESIPTGEIGSVAGTPFDFREPFTIGARIAQPDELLRRAGGYDQNYVLRGEAGAMKPAARLSEPASGRVMEVLTTQPGMQFYTGNLLNGKVTGKEGIAYQKHYGLCLETQHFPDSPHHPHFPSTVLIPGDRFTSTTVYRFSVE